jgi:ABC-type Na+ transport system ATPase subunit NatA
VPVPAKSGGMPLLECNRAALEGPSGPIVPPVTLSLDDYGRLAYACFDAATAASLALMACGMQRPSSGAVYVADFDTRVQPVQVKRIAAFVPHEALPPAFRSFDAYVEYRADLWGIARREALSRACAALERLRGVHEAFAYPLAGALISKPRLLVLDRPQVAYAKHIASVTAQCAVFSTHAGEEEAAAFRRQAVLR